MRFRLALLALSLPACASAAVAPTASSSTAAPLAAIAAASLSEYVRTLAGDAMEGRGTGTRGYERAAAYVADQLRASGAVPAGQDGTFFQHVPLRGMTLDYAKQSLTIEGVALTHEVDFFYGSDPTAPSVDLDAPLVFVGYGVSAPSSTTTTRRASTFTASLRSRSSARPCPSEPTSSLPDAHASRASARPSSPAARPAETAAILIVETPELDDMMAWPRYVDSGRSSV